MNQAPGAVRVYNDLPTVVWKPVRITIATAWHVILHGKLILAVAGCVVVWCFAMAWVVTLRAYTQLLHLTANSLEAAFQDVEGHAIQEGVKVVEEKEDVGKVEPKAGTAAAVGTETPKHEHETGASAPSAGTVKYFNRLLSTGGRDTQEVVTSNASEHDVASLRTAEHVRRELEAPMEDMDEILQRIVQREQDMQQAIAAAEREDSKAEPELSGLHENAGPAYAGVTPKEYEVATTRPNAVPQAVSLEDRKAQAIPHFPLSMEDRKANAQSRSPSTIHRPAELPVAGRTTFTAEQLAEARSFSKEASRGIRKQIVAPTRASPMKPAATLGRSHGSSLLNNRHVAQATTSRGAQYAKRSSSASPALPRSNLSAPRMPAATVTSPTPPRKEYTNGQLPPHLRKQQAAIQQRSNSEEDAFQHNRGPDLSVSKNASAKKPVPAAASENSYGRLKVDDLVSEPSTTVTGHEAGKEAAAVPMIAVQPATPATSIDMTRPNIDKPREPSKKRSSTRIMSIDQLLALRHLAAPSVPLPAAYLRDPAAVKNIAAAVGNVMEPVAGKAKKRSGHPDLQDVEFDTDLSSPAKASTAGLRPKQVSKLTATAMPFFSRQQVATPAQPTPVAATATAREIQSSPLVVNGPLSGSSVTHRGDIDYSGWNKGAVPQYGYEADTVGRDYAHQAVGYDYGHAGLPFPMPGTPEQSQMKQHHSTISQQLATQQPTSRRSMSRAVSIVSPPQLSSGSNVAPTYAQSSSRNGDPEQFPTDVQHGMVQDQAVGPQSQPRFTWENPRTRSIDVSDVASKDNSSGLSGTNGGGRKVSAPPGMQNPQADYQSAFDALVMNDVHWEPKTTSLAEHAAEEHGSTGGASLRFKKLFESERRREDVKELTQEDPEITATSAESKAFAAKFRLPGAVVDPMVQASNGFKTGKPIETSPKAADEFPGTYETASPPSGPQEKIKEILELSSRTSSPVSIQEGAECDSPIGSGEETMQGQAALAYDGGDVTDGEILATKAAPTSFPSDTPDLSPGMVELMSDLTSAENTKTKDATPVTGSVKQLKKAQKKAIREELAAMWWKREQIRKKAQGTGALHLSDLEAATRSYNEKRDELKSSAGNGELNGEDANDFPFLAVNDVRAPKHHPPIVDDTKSSSIGSQEDRGVTPEKSPEPANKPRDDLRRNAKIALDRYDEATAYLKLHKNIKQKHAEGVAKVGRALDFYRMKRDKLEGDFPGDQWLEAQLPELPGNAT